MWELIFGGLTAVVNGAVTAYNKSKDVSITAIQASVGLAASQVQAMTLWIGHPFSPPSLLAYAVAIYYGKAIAYDNVISFWITGHAGYTPALIPTTAAVAGLVVAGMFSSGIANIIKR
jgi:hypothetical protein